MEVNLTVTISVIIALIALISPIAVAIINNRYQIKIRKIEIQQEISKKQIDVYYSDKKTAYINFLQIAGTYRLFSDKEQMMNNLCQLNTSANLAILFCDEENKKKIADFLSYANRNIGLTLNDRTISNDKYMLVELSSVLNDELADFRNKTNTTTKTC